MIIKKRQNLLLIPKFKKVVITILIMAILCCWWQKDFLLINILSQGVNISPPANFHQEPVSISLSTFISGDIYYTFDGSEPTSKSQRFENNFTVSESSVLRYAVFQKEKRVTPVQSHDILINDGHTIPIITITTSPENLWSPETGIYVSGNHENNLQSGEKWERPAEFNFYDENKNLVFSRQIGLRLHGNNMRNMPQKGLRIYFQDQNGKQSNLKYPLFGPEGNQEYESVILRNSGDPSTFLRDRLATKLVLENSDVVAQRSRPAVVYLNGKYWGIYYLYERFDGTYFSEKFQVKPNALATIEVPLADWETRGHAIADSKNSDADAEYYNKLVTDVRQCDKCGDFRVLNKFIDMDNLIDYYIFQLYFANIDWPYNNAKAWRYSNDDFAPETEISAELDGRLRWLFFDMDAGFGANKDSAQGMIDSAITNPYDKLIDPAFPFGNMFNNITFRRKYQQRVKTLTQSTLSAANMQKVAEELASEIRAEVPLHLERWNDENATWGYAKTHSLEQWEQELDLLDLYLQNRPTGFNGRTSDFFQ
jgi:hypothetical protein